jgi:hypothetical protein
MEVIEGRVLAYRSGGYPRVRHNTLSQFVFLSFAGILG